MLSLGFMGSHGLSALSFCISFFFFFKDFTYSFLERGEGREKEREKHRCARYTYPLVASCGAPTGYLAHKPGMCPDWELNW